MGNRIPRKFTKLTGEMMVNTTVSKIGDVMHVFKNDCSTGYLALNTRTKEYAYMFASMLRNPELFKLVSVE